LVETNPLPDYHVSIDRDIVTFTHRKAPMIEDNTPTPLLKPETFVKARRVAPGWDVYYLEGLWRDWMAGREMPKNPDVAFIAFCRKKYQREGMP